MPLVFCSKAPSTRKSQYPDYQEIDNRNIYLDSALFYLAKDGDEFKQDPVVNFYTGEAYFLYGKYNDALNAYKKAAELKPDYHEAHFKLGWIYKMQGKNEAAIHQYLEALKYKPLEPTYKEGLAYAYLNLGDFNKTKDLFEELLQTDRQNEYSFYALGTIYALYLHQPAEAMGYFLTASIMNPDIENVFFIMPFLCF